ncbi:MAG TPA: PIN domain-containing protein [Anaerolineales bacterium]|nr:PIN domain-containing protein [Anaerolineales bacterium]
MITAVELLAGCRNQTEQRRVEREIALYAMLWIDESISQAALTLYQRHHLSHGMGFFDCLIAATARQHQLQVATLNTKHFAAIAGLDVKRPY